MCQGVSARTMLHKRRKFVHTSVSPSKHRASGLHESSTLANDVFDASPFTANGAIQKDHVLLFGRVEFNVYRLWSSFGSNFGDILEISYQRPSLISRIMLEHKWCLHYKSGTKVARASSCFLLSETKKRTAMRSLEKRSSKKVNNDFRPRKKDTKKCNSGVSQFTKTQSILLKIRKPLYRVISFLVHSG